MAKNSKGDKPNDKPPGVETAAKTPESTPVSDAPAPKRKFKDHVKAHGSRFWQHKKWTVPIAAILLIVILLFAVPFTRYKVLGLFLTENLSVSVTDSTTHTPVSGAHLQFGSVTATTTAAGKANLKLPVGNGTLSISKQYYQNAADKILVSYSKSHNAVSVKLVATGRQVPVTVVNKITGKPVANAELKVLDTEAKTDKNGRATIVLPSKAATQSGQLSASGYNQAAVKVHVTGQAVPANTFSLTPSGSIYFLSNLSGKIDVVKTNLDGTDRTTVLAGTGNEDPNNTLLLASRDWKYLALLAQRKATGNPELDLIDTSTDKMSNIDSGNATFDPVGWSGDHFIYEVNRSSGQTLLKSFNPSTKTINILALSTKATDSSGDSQGQTLDNVYEVGDQVVYSLDWFENNNSDPGSVNLSGKQDTLYSVNGDGSNRATVKSFSLQPGHPICNQYSANLSVNPSQQTTKPNVYDVQFSQSQGCATGTSYYTYANGKLSEAPNPAGNQRYVAPPTYLESPSGSQLFWAQPTDGKNDLMVGDQSANNAKTIATLSDYSPYGWYTGSYLLVSKNGSELYIMPVGGGTPLRITDYYKAPRSFEGYGGGYGGL